MSRFPFGNMLDPFYLESHGTRWDPWLATEEHMNCQRLREDTRREHVVYEIYPDLRWQAADMPLSWFEIALHAEAEEYQPSSTPRSCEVFAVLMELAEFLIQQIRFHMPCEVEMSPSYFTLHSPDRSDSRSRLSRSLSLVFLNIERDMDHRATDHREPAVLTLLKTQLRLLDISRLDVECSGNVGTK